MNEFKDEQDSQKDSIDLELLQKLLYYLYMGIGIY